MRLAKTIVPIRVLIIICTVVFSSVSVNAQQQLKIRDFVLWGGASGFYDSTKELYVHDGTTITGNIGSHNVVRGGNSYTVSGNINSGNRIDLGDAFTISGSVTANNNFVRSTPLISAGISGVFQSPGNLSARGKIGIVSGSVAGAVRVPSVGTDYSGPPPAGGISTSNGQEATLFSPMPNMPAVYFYTSSSSGPSITGSATITPGIYNILDLDGNDTLVFSGTGSYFFNGIDLDNFNVFIFDANGNTTDNIKIHVAGNAGMAELVCRLQNGADPGRIYTEVYGNGAGVGGWAFELSGQAPAFSASEGSNWYGSLWAPYGNILISTSGGGAPSRIEGAMWTAGKLQVMGGNFIHSPLTENVLIDPVSPHVPEKNKILEYMLFSGKPGVSVLDSSAIGIEAFQNSVLSGGNVGSYGMVRTIGSTVSGNIHSNHRVRFDNGVTVNGQVYANNSTGSNVPALLADGNAVFEMNLAGLMSNLNVNGHIRILPLSATSKITGQVSQPFGMTYQGPSPDSGFFYGTWANVPMPVLPEEASISAGASNVTSPQTIAPGNYAALQLTGGDLVFSSPGDYHFSQITNTGNLTTLQFELGTPGIYRIFVKNMAHFGRIKSRDLSGNPSDGSRIYLETQAPTGIGFRLDTDPTSTNWNGTVYAPNSMIQIGSAIGSPTHINGALWSGTKIFMSQGTNLTYVPLVSPTAVSFIEPYYPPPASGKVDTASNLIGSELSSLLAYQATIDTITENKIFRITNDSVMIEAVALSGHFTDVYNFLTNVGLTDTIPNEANSLIITGKFPIAKLDTINTRPDIIDYARPLFPAINNTHIREQGTVVSQGDRTIKADLVKRGYEIGGDSVKVGVMSDSYDTKDPGQGAFNITNHDLHDSVQVVREYPARASDEGRAMMQIVHDVAPKAKLAFRTGTLSAGDFAIGIRQLSDANLAGGRCDIIVDDITWPTEPFFHDGRVARAVNDVKAAGVTYFSAAGNFGTRSYEGDFLPGSVTPSGLTGVAHNFDTSITQKLILKQGTYMIVLQWDDNFYSLDGIAGVTNDLDMYLVGFGGRRLFGFNRNNTGGDPLEVLPFTVTEDTEADLMIVKASGSGNPRFKYIIFRGDGTIVGNSSPGSTLVGQANAEGAIAVGAILYENIPRFTPVYPAPASFSSRGGTGVRVPGVSGLVVRQKPELIAPNGVNTTVNFGSENIDGDHFHNFFGTSASAPHVAGAAALLVEAKKKFNLQNSVTADEIRELLQSTATDMGTTGFDMSSGYGLVNTSAAMRTLGNPKPSILRLYSTDSLAPGGFLPLPTTNGRFALIIHGENFIDTTKVLFNGNLIPSVYIDENRIWARIDSFTGNPTIQLVTGAKSVSGRDGGHSQIVPLWDNRNVIIISPRDTSRKYGQNNPAFTSLITVNGVNIEETSYTLQQFGLDRLEYITDAAPQSAINIYPVSARLVLNPVADTALINHNIYQFNNPAALTIRPLPITITPQNKSIRYGDDLGNVSYNYEFDETNISNPSALRDSVRIHHEKYLADNVFAVISGYGLAGTPGGSLTESDLVNMSTMASFQSVRNARRFAVENGKLNPLAPTDSVTNLGIERLIVDVSATSLYKNKLTPLSATFDSAYSGVHTRSFVNAQKLATGRVQATLDADVTSLSNGQLMAMINGQLMALVNGQLMALVNGELIAVDSLFMVNGQLMALVNGDSTFALTSGQLMAIVNGVAITVDISTAVVINGETTVVINGQLMAMVNGQLMAMVNGQLMAMINGQLMALVNGQLMALVNGQLMALVNGELKIVTSLSIENGQLMAVINGQLMALVNGQLMALVNGQLMAMVNGQLMAMINGSTQYGIVQSLSLVSGQLMAVINDVEGVVNGQLMAMVNGLIDTVTNVSMINGQLMAMVNDLEVAIVNGQLMALVNDGSGVVNGQLMALVNDLGFPAGASNSKSGVIVDEDDINIQDGAVGGMVALNTITGLEPGIQKLIPGSFAHPHFSVTYGLGQVNIDPALVTFSVNDTSRRTGIPNPTFEVTVSGFAFGDNISTITAPSVVTAATITSPAGTYPITFAGGSGNGRYQLVYENGELTVYSKTPLTIQANTKVVNQGSMLPVFTSTVTGLLNNDQLTISYTGSAVNTAVAGQYTNMPLVDTTLYPQYQFTFIPAPFYVNPYGIGAKKVSVKKECVRQLTQPVRGFSYMAVFSYTNTNSTPVYIPRGPDNQLTITSGGSFENSLPEVFQPGTHQIAVYFSGHNMYWAVRSIESFHKTAVLSDANATTRCDAPVVTFAQVKKELQTEVAEERKFALAPNPATSSIRLSLPGSWIKGSEVVCVDAMGRKVNLPVAVKGSNSDLNINLAGLSKGVYFVSIQTTEGNKTLRFVKQ